MDSDADKATVSKLSSSTDTAPSAMTDTTPPAPLNPATATLADFKQAREDVDADHDGEAGAQFVGDVYKSLSSISRPALLDLNLRFLVDPRFREYAERFNTPHVQQQFKSRSRNVFRFMDLPTEIRLIIAGYALTDDKPLTVYDTTLRESCQKNGFFNPSKTVLALRQVSRQMRAETSGLVMKLNTIQFVVDNVGFIGFAADSFPVDEFLRKAKPQVLENIRHILYDVGLPTSDELGWGYIESLTEMAQQLSSAEVEIRDELWHVWFESDSDYDLVPAGEALRLDGDSESDSLGEIISEFLSKGRTIKKDLSNAGLNDINRDWRIFPSITLKSNDRRLSEHLSPADYKMAVDWIENGL